MNISFPNDQLINQDNILSQLKIDQAIRLAEKKVRAGKFNEAKKIYNDILEKFPKNKRALNAVSNLSFGLAKVKSLSNDPNNLMLAPIVQLFNSGHHNQVIENSIKLLETFPNSSMLHNLCGAANAELGRYDIAIIGYKTAVSLKPDFMDAIFNMGVAQKELGNLDEAINSYKTVLKKDPKNPDAWNNLGMIYADQGFADKALKSFEKAISFNEKHLLAHFNKANTLREMEKFDSAFACYKKVLSINPNFDKAYTSLGAILKHQGEIEKAIENYSRALKINPNYAEAHFLLGNAKTELLEYNEALNHFRDAIDLKNNYPEALANMGDIYLEKDYAKDALASYKAAHELDPESVDILCSLALSHRLNFELDISIEKYQAALELDPESSGTYSGYAIALNDNGQIKEAMKNHNLAIKKDPESVAALLNYGSSLDKNGELEKAIKILTKTLAIKPDYLSAHTNLGFLRLFQGDLEGALEHRKWRWTSKEGQKKISNLELPEWDGKEPLKGKRVLALGEQGPGDIIMWSPGLEYLKNLGGQVTLECHAKLIELFKMSFTDIEIKPIDTKKTIGPDDYDYYIPMETLFGYFCINEQKRDKTLNFAAPAQLKTDPFLFPKQERIDFWKDRLNKIGKGPFVGISWKSPKITYARKKNYTEISDWEPLFSLPNITFINLQSKAFEEDLLKIKEKYSVHVHNFDDLDHYDDLADVAALCAALDVCVSVSTAVSTVAGAVGTPTKMLHWRRSSWNNVLFTPPGPNVKIYEKDTWESWENCFKLIAKELKNFKILG